MRGNYQSVIPVTCVISFPFFLRVSNVIIRMVTRIRIATSVDMHITEMGASTHHTVGLSLSCGLAGILSIYTLLLNKI